MLRRKIAGSRAFSEVATSLLVTSWISQCRCGPEECPEEPDYTDDLPGCHLLADGQVGLDKLMAVAVVVLTGADFAVVAFSAPDLGKGASCTRPEVAHYGSVRGGGVRGQRGGAGPNGGSNGDAVRRCRSG